MIWIRFFQAPPRPDWSARSLDMFAPSALSWRPFQHMTNLFWTAEYAGALQNWVSTYTCLLSVETSDLKKNSYSQQRDRFKNSPLKNPSNSQSWQQALVAEKEPLMGKIDSNRNAAKQACFFLFAFGSPFYKRSDSKKKTWRKLGQKTCIPTISLITCLLGASSYGWLLPGYIQGTEAFSRSCPPRTACSLCCRSLWDGRNQQGLHTNSRVVDLATKWEFLWRNPQLEWKLILNSIYTKLKTPW